MGDFSPMTESVETSQRFGLRLGLVACHFGLHLVLLLRRRLGLEHDFEFFMFHALGALAVTSVSGLALLGQLSHLLSFGS